MTLHDARAILRVLERAGIPATISALPGDCAEIRLLGIIAYDVEDVMEVVREHYSDQMDACERLQAEIDASSTIEAS